MGFVFSYRALRIFLDRAGVKWARMGPARCVTQSGVGNSSSQVTGEPLYKKRVFQIRL